MPLPKGLRPPEAFHGMWNPNKSSLYDVNRTGGRRGVREPCFLANDRAAILPPVFGGAGRDRTDDPLLAKQVLSHLSYGP